MSWYRSALALFLVVLAGAVEANEARSTADLARLVGCLACHGIDKRSNDDDVGPPFRAVAEKYHGNAAARQRLMTSISKGSKGTWGAMTRGVPMPPYSARLTKDEIARLADWILALKAPTR